MAKAIYKIFKQDTCDNLSVPLEPDFSVASGWIADLKNMKALISNWNNEIEWLTIGDKEEGTIYTPNPFSVLHFQLFKHPLCDDDDPNFGKVFGFNVTVKCHSFQQDIEDRLCELARINSWTIRRMEWTKIT